MAKKDDRHNAKIPGEIHDRYTAWAAEHGLDHKDGHVVSQLLLMVVESADPTLLDLVMKHQHPADRAMLAVNVLERMANKSLLAVAESRSSYLAEQSSKADADFELLDAPPSTQSTARRKRGNAKKPPPAA